MSSLIREGRTVVKTVEVWYLLEWELKWRKEISEVNVDTGKGKGYIGPGGV